MRKISRATDDLFYLASEGEEVAGEYDTPPDRGPYSEDFTDDQFNMIHKLYHQGHEEGTHDREVHDFVGETDPLAALELQKQQEFGHQINHTILIGLSHQSKEPDHVRFSWPYWWTQGYKHGRGGDYHYSGFKPSKYGVVYSPPKREDPMNRNGPFD